MEMLPMRDGRTNDERRRTREDRATQPMDAGWLSFAIVGEDWGCISPRSKKSIPSEKQEIHPSEKGKSTPSKKAQCVTTCF